MTDGEAEMILKRWAGLTDRLVGRYLAAGAAVGMEADDLRQVGRLAILAAVQKHDPQGGQGLLSFLWTRTSWALTRSLDRARPAGCKGEHVPLPRAVRLLAAGETLDSDNSAGFRAEDLAAPEADQGGARPGGDMEALRLAVARLPARERHVLALRFGLDRAAPLSRPAVGRREGISEERVREIEARALRRLRHWLSAAAGQEPPAGVSPALPESRSFNLANRSAAISADGGQNGQS